MGSYPNIAALPLDVRKGLPFRRLLLPGGSASEFEAQPRHADEKPGTERHSLSAHQAT